MAPSTISNIGAYSAPFPDGKPPTMTTRATPAGRASQAIQASVDAAEWATSIAASSAASSAFRTARCWSSSVAFSGGAP